jgi:hypothetical protein
MENQFPCRHSRIQEYDCCVYVVPRWKSAHKCICFDKCLANELFYLWDLGIVTTGSCCGRHKTEKRPEGENGEYAYIGVSEEFIPLMKELGYKVHINSTDLTREDSFVPKTFFQK